jgi:chemotaxis response regulator CheB
MMNTRDIPVLLVDDNPLVRRHLQRLLTDHPNIHIVGQVATGPEALESVGILRPTVVLLNISMPGMDVVTTALAIRRRYPTVVVIGLSITTQADPPLERSERQEETAKRFRALGEPVLHATWRSRHGDSRPRSQAHVS